MEKKTIGTSKVPNESFELIEKMQQKMAEEIAASVDKNVFESLFHTIESQTHKPLYVNSLATLNNAFGKATGIPVSAITDVDSSINQETHLTNEAFRIAIDKMPNDEIIGRLINKMNRVGTGSIINAVLDFIVRHTDSILADTDRRVTAVTNENFLDVLKERLEEVDGVTRVQPLVNSFPESASVIIKLDMAYMDDVESQERLQDIDDIIQSCKPQDLLELEIIYHNKVVY